MQVIDTKNAPGAIGPYSQAFDANGFVITSGQIPVDPASGAVPEGIAAQAEQSCKNVGAILEAAGTGFDRVLKTTCFLADMGDFAAFNEVYARYFVSKPARSCVAVKALPKGVLCEIEAIAVKYFAKGAFLMKITVIGSHLCPDTLYAVNRLAGAGVETSFRDILSCHADLQAYLHIRETSELYADIRGTQRLGVPCFVREDGSMTLSLDEVLA